MRRLRPRLASRISPASTLRRNVAMMPIVKNTTRTTTAPAMISEGSIMLAPWLPACSALRDDGDGNALATSIHVLDAQDVTDGDGDARVVLAQGRGELHDAPVTHDRDQAAPVAEGHDGARLGEEQRLERGARLALEPEEEAPDRADEHPLDDQGRHGRADRR